MRIELEPHAAAPLSAQDPAPTGAGRRWAYRIADGFAVLAALGISGAILANVVLNPHKAALTAAEGRRIVLEDQPRTAPSAMGPGTSSLFSPTALSSTMLRGTGLTPSAPGALPTLSPSTKTAAASMAAPPAPSPVAVPKLPVPRLADIQKELARRGFYDGAADGLPGPRTDAAIRAFEQAARLKVTGEPSEALLAQIRRAPLPTATTEAARSMRPPADVPVPARF